MLLLQIELTWRMRKYPLKWEGQTDILSASAKPHSKITVFCFRYKKPRRLHNAPCIYLWAQIYATFSAHLNDAGPSPISKKHICPATLHFLRREDARFPSVAKIQFTITCQVYTRKRDILSFLNPYLNFIKSLQQCRSEFSGKSKSLIQSVV